MSLLQILYRKCFLWYCYKFYNENVSYVFLNFFRMEMFSYGVFLYNFYIGDVSKYFLKWLTLFVLKLYLYFNNSD